MSSNHIWWIRKYTTPNQNPHTHFSDHLVDARIQSNISRSPTHIYHRYRNINPIAEIQTQFSKTQNRNEFAAIDHLVVIEDVNVAVLLSLAALALVIVGDSIGF